MIENCKETLDYFKKCLPINPYNLERECQEQSSLYEEIGEWVSGVKAEAKTAKEHIEFVKADLFLKIRRDPEKYDLTGKITNELVNAVVTTHKDYQQAVKNYIEVDKFANDASNLLTSAEQRKSMLRDLVRLFIYSYYSREDVVGDKDWKSAEQAIIDMRNEKAIEYGENREEEEYEER